MSNTLAISLACVGAFLSEAFTLEVHRRKVWKRWPKAVRSPLYYAFSAIRIFAGGVLAYAHNVTPGVELSAWLALNIGLTAPLIVQQASKSIGAPPPGTAH